MRYILENNNNIIIINIPSVIIFREKHFFQRVSYIKDGEIIGWDG
jgi:hypothetical protein